MIRMINIKENKVNRVLKEFARLGRICDVVRVTGYSRSLVSAVVGGRYSVIEIKDVTIQNSSNIEDYPAPEPANMENFGNLQYIIDILPVFERMILRNYFVYGMSKAEIARCEWANFSTSVVDRVLRNLRKIDLTGDRPMITFNGKACPLISLDSRDYVKQSS